MSWIDSHCHLQERYRADDASVAELLRAATAAEVDGVVVVGTDEVTSTQALDLAADVASGRLGDGLPAVRAVIGLHPHEATAGTNAIAALLARRRDLVAGIGEAGLDYHYDHSPRDVQRVVFAEQVAMAQGADLPLVIHARDAWDDLFDVLGSEGVPRRTVLHCFTGGPREAERCLEAGMVVSFSGIVSFPKAPEVREAAAIVPLDRLLVETDSPFLAPVPHRGKTNQPAWVGAVGQAVAAAKNLDASVVAAATAANAARVFGFTDR